MCDISYVASRVYLKLTRTRITKYICVQQEMTPGGVQLRACACPSRCALPAIGITLVPQAAYLVACWWSSPSNDAYTTLSYTNFTCSSIPTNLLRFFFQTLRNVAIRSFVPCNDAIKPANVLGNMQRDWKFYEISPVSSKIATFSNIFCYFSVKFGTPLFLNPIIQIIWWVFQKRRK